MQIDQWLTAISSLVGAIIGASAALTAQYIQSRHTRIADAERERKLAIEEVLVRAQAVDLRAHNMTLLASDVGSLTGLMARILGSVAAVDYAAMFDKIGAEADALNRAAAQVWLFGDDKTVRLTNAVVLAASDVVEAHTRPKGGKVGLFILIALFGRHSRDEDQVGSTRHKLAEARRALVDHTRQSLKLEHVDLFALPIAVES